MCLTTASCDRGPGGRTRVPRKVASDPVNGTGSRKRMFPFFPVRFPHKRLLVCTVLEFISVHETRLSCPPGSLFVPERLVLPRFLDESFCDSGY